MRQAPDRSRTIDELEGTESAPPAYESYLVTTCHRLRKKPIGQFTAEDLRIMIGQGIGLPYLIPLALDLLGRDPLAQGDYYPGDLLHSLLGVDCEFWSREWQWRDQLKAIVASIERVPVELNDAIGAVKKMGGPTTG